MICSSILLVCIIILTNAIIIMFYLQFFLLNLIDGIADIINMLCTQGRMDRSESDVSEVVGAVSRRTRWRHSQNG
jgi:hypothetical protein